VADERFKSITPSRVTPPELDTSVAHPARVYDYWLGGKDNDPIVLAHARALLTSTPEGATAYLAADLRTSDTILQAAAKTLDFDQPVAVMLIGIMPHDKADKMRLIMSSRA